MKTFLLIFLLFAAPAIAADVSPIDAKKAAVDQAMDALQRALYAQRLAITEAVVPPPPVAAPTVPSATITVVPAPPLPTPPPTVPLDLTNVALSLITGIFGILGIILPIVINARIKDKQAAATLAAAVANSLGAGEQALKGEVIAVGPKIALPAGVPASLLPNIQYVMDHAGDEAARFGITPVAIASKISAQLGLAARATDAAVVVAQATPVATPVRPVFNVTQATQPIPGTQSGGTKYDPRPDLAATAQNIAPAWSS
jgi:hypothetical protein